MNFISVDVACDYTTSINRNYVCVDSLNRLVYVAADVRLFRPLSGMECTIHDTMAS